MTTGSAVQVETQPRVCERHGDYLAHRWRDRWSGCPKCSDEAIEQRLTEERERDRIERVDRLLRRSGIPARFEGVAFDESIPAQLRAWAAKLIAGESCGPAVLVGGVGTGKTHAACATLGHLIRAGYAGSFTSPSEFGRLIRDQWTAHERTEASIVKEFAEAPVLVLDDLGAHRAIDTELLQELIGTRYANDQTHATIITSNLSAAKFAGVIGERAADRIREGATVMPMTGRSRRCPAP